MHTALSLARSTRLALGLCGSLAGLWLAPLALKAQTALPAATPSATPEPSPQASPTPEPTSTPAPTSAPSDTPVLTLTPGVPDAAVQADYTDARTPEASIVLTTPGGTTNSAVGKALGAGRAQSVANVSATLQPVVFKGASTIVSLAPAASPVSTTQKVATSASAATASSVPLAVVTLNYGVAWAGQPVAVRPLGGGVVSGTDANGNVYNASSGLLLAVDSTGALTFGFQAPSAAKTYQVLTRLDTVATTFTFTVPDGNE